MPELSVLYTADDDAVLEFLHDWWGEWHLGLMVARHDNRTCGGPLGGHLMGKLDWRSTTRVSNISP